MNNYREVGAKIREFILSRECTRQQINGLLSDLLAGDEALAPMRQPVISEAFSTIEDLVGSGRGIGQRTALLHELGKTYAPHIVSAIDNIISGILDLPSISSPAPESGQNKHPFYSEDVRHTCGNNSEYLQEEIFFCDIYEVEASRERIADKWAINGLADEGNGSNREEVRPRVAPAKSTIYTYQKHRAAKDAEYMPISEVADSLRTPTGFLVQWFNRSRSKGETWRGPRSLLSPEEVDFAIRSHKRPARLIQAIYPALIFIIIILPLALVILVGISHLF